MPDIYDQHENLYSHTWAIDKYHVRILQRLIEAVDPAVYLEVGSFQGASALAVFLAAQSCQSLKTIGLIEPLPREPLPLMVTEFNRRWAPQKSAALIQRKFHPMDLSSDRIAHLATHPAPSRTPRPEFIFIDGDHKRGDLEVMGCALDSNIHFIAMHDTNSVNIGYTNCHGSAKAAQMIRDDSRYHVLEDQTKRNGMRTDRGFLLGVRIGTFKAQHVIDQARQFLR